MEEAREVMERLDRLDIRFADVAARLEREGVQQFAEAFDKSINAIKKNARL
jgi:transaldolase